MDIEKLLGVMKALRNPDSGCPWDLKQTFTSIVPYSIEEVYEVAEAIDNNDMPELKLELGDLLFQIVFYCQLANEQAEFDFSDVVAAIVEKMIRRHPHVFADTVYKDEEEFAKAWQQNKDDERATKNKTTDSVLDGLSKALPALKSAQKMQSRVSKLGFDWKSIEPVYDKIAEEIAEVRQAVANNDRENTEEEVGDLLFSVVNLSRHLKIDAEDALRKATNKFEHRFRQVELHCNDMEENMLDKTEQELIVLWNKYKTIQ